MTAFARQLHPGEAIVREEPVTYWYYFAQVLWAVVAASAIMLLAAVAVVLSFRAARVLGAPLMPILSRGAVTQVPAEPFQVLATRAVVVVGAAMALVVTYAFLQTATWRYALTDSRLIIQKGLFTRTYRAAELSRVQDVTVRQRLPGRLLNYGWVVVETAGTSGKLVLSWVDDPHGWANALLRGRS